MTYRVEVFTLGKWVPALEFKLGEAPKQIVCATREDADREALQFEKEGRHTRIVDVDGEGIVACWPPREEYCPERLAAALTRYAKEGVPTGSFLRAVLENDLKEAIGRADDTNGPLLPHIVAFCYNRLPSAAWGSRDRVDVWIERFRSTRKSFVEQIEERGAVKASDIAVLLADQLRAQGAATVELKTLQYTTADLKGPWRLHAFEDDGSGRYTSYWVARIPEDTPTELTVATARKLVTNAIAAGREIRVTNPGDTLVFHFRDGKVEHGEGFIEAVWNA